MGSRNQVVFGVYRRHIKTIGYLGQIDEIFGARATTRSWNTITQSFGFRRLRPTYDSSGQRATRSLADAWPNKERMRLQDSVPVDVRPDSLLSRRNIPGSY